MKREEILRTAEKLICGERQAQYGDAAANFGVVAKLWQAYTGLPYSVSDVAMMLALLKVARIAGGYKEDNFVDLAGYAALAGEIAANEQHRKDDDR